MTTQRTGRTRASIVGGRISIANGWSLAGGSFSTKFAWVSGGKFSIPVGIMPGADLLSSVALVAGAPTMSQPSATGLQVGASVAGGRFTLTGTPAAAAISTPAVSISGGLFSTTARNIPGGALTAGASLNAGFAGGGPGGGILSAGATMVGGFFAATQNGAPLTSTASVVGGAPFVPYSFARVALQIPGNGTNNSTSIVDVSSNALTITRSGSPVISTAASVYGGASVRMANATSDRLTINSSSLNVGSEDFWIEMWLKQVTNIVQYFITLSHDNVSNFNPGSYINFFVNSGGYAEGRIQLLTSGGVFNADIPLLTVSAVPSNFNHFAAGRVNGELAVWFAGQIYQFNRTALGGNGKNIGTRAVTALGNFQYHGPRARSFAGVGYFDNYPDVYFDDFRFVKATPPWGLGNFTPSGPHPTS